MERNMLLREINALIPSRYFPPSFSSKALRDDEVKMFGKGLYGNLKEKSFLRKEDLSTKQTFEGKALFYPEGYKVDILGEKHGWFLVSGNAMYNSYGVNIFYSEYNRVIDKEGWIKKAWVENIKEVVGTTPITVTPSSDGMLSCDSAEWKAIRDAFKTQKWDLAYVERGKKDTDETYQKKVDAAKEFKDRIYAVLKKAGEDPDVWYNNFTDITFLGRSFNHPIHIEFATHLKIVEKKLAAKYGGPSNDPKKAGDVLQLTMSSLKGGRRVSDTADTSMHTFGLAMDVNYDENPYLGGTYKRSSYEKSNGEKVSIKSIIAKIKDQLGNQDIKFSIKGEVGRASKKELVNIIFEHMGLLLNGKAEAYPEDFTYAKRLTLFDTLERLSNMLVRYFNLGATEINTLLAKAKSGTFWYGKDLETAKTQINLDWMWFCGFIERWDDDNPQDNQDNIKANGFIKLDKRFVDELGLDWGATYGDIMHFDMRNKCIGKIIDKSR